MSLKLKIGELDAIKTAAKRADKMHTTWAREALLRAVKRQACK